VAVSEFEFAGSTWLVWMWTRKLLLVLVSRGTIQNLFVFVALSVSGVEHLLSGPRDIAIVDIP
jgi:hypothetical protein